MTVCTPDLLERAIAGRLAGTLTVPPDEREQWQVRFLARDAAHDGVWVEPIDDSRRPLDSVIARGLPVQVALCLDHARHAFRTQVVRRNKHFWLTQSMMFQALLLRGPIEPFPAERRAHPRYQVPDGSHIFAQILPRGSASTAAALFPVRVRPWDASATGLSFICPRENAVMGLKPNDTLDVLLNYRGRTIRAAASVRFTRFLTERVIKTGVRLIQPSMDPSSQENYHFFLTEVIRLARPRVGVTVR